MADAGIGKPIGTVNIDRDGASEVGHDGRKASGLSHGQANSQRERRAAHQHMGDDAVKAVTVGWILEDAWEAYLEAQPTAERPPPDPTRIRCPFCMARFNRARELTAHLGDQHRGERPILLFRGLEPAKLQHHRVGTSLRRTDVILQNCSAAVVSVNAGPQQALPPAELPKLLSSQTDLI